MIITRDLSQQYVDLLFALGTGFLLGILYDFFRLIRNIFNAGKVHILISDILFMIISAIVTFIMMLAVNYGIIRAYLAAGELAGFVIYKVSVGRVIYIILFGFFSAVKKVCNVIIRPFVKILNTIKRKVNGLSEKSLKIMKKKIKNRKNSLET